jgi:hypothetical protein
MPPHHQKQIKGLRLAKIPIQAKIVIQIRWTALERQGLPLWAL